MKFDDVSPEGFLGVYLFLEKSHNIDYELLFSKSNINIKNSFLGKPLFIDQKYALEYGRFMGENGVLIKIYVPDFAIVSHNQMLTLKKEHLKNLFIHGYFLIDNKRHSYYKNPQFDHEFITAVDNKTLEIEHILR